ncbi:hypothetical protein V7S43_010678 [Phytophthora oleae]|uniref:BZIP domain-containing protein n=1 Tax=Phytophthora oleae TaxID=2107226 RepID=A0ABD3FH82_9STRA
MATRSRAFTNKSLNDHAVTVSHKPVTRTASKRPIEPQLPVHTALISSALKSNSLAPSPSPPHVKIAPASTPVIAPALASPLKANSPPIKATPISPSEKSDHRKRRKREPINIPPEAARAKLSTMEMRRLKNRIAATRLRQRSQQHLQLLHEQRDYYQSRCQLLEIVLSSCATCQSLAAMQFGDIELLSVELEDTSIKKQTVDEELSDSTMLTEAKCIVLDHVLHS